MKFHKGNILKGMISASIAASLALPLAGAATAQAHASQESMSQASGQRANAGGRYDQQILADLAKKLGSDKFKNVKYSVDDEIVDLTGTVDLLSRKDEADRRAHHVDHVSGVRNQIEVAGENLPDEQLRSRLADKIRYDRVGQGILFNSFTLGVKDGVVTLGGEVRTDVDNDSVVSIIENTKGVKDLLNNVKVSPTGFHDDDLRIALARRIYGDSSLSRYANDPEAPIRIIVDNGHVTLAGVVDSAMDKQIAGVRANEVPGVFSVDNKLMVANGQGK